MENGLYAAVKTNDTVHAVFIDQESLDFCKLNRKTEQRNYEKACYEADVARKQAEEARMQKDIEQKQEKAIMRWERETIRLIKQELKVLAASAVVAMSLYAGLVAAAFAIPILIGCQIVICFRAGKYFGKYPVRWFK